MFLIGFVWAILTQIPLPLNKGFTQQIASATRPQNGGSKYLLVWSSDKGTDDGKQDPDFLAVVDATKGSPTYGKVVNTANVPEVPNANLLTELGLRPNTPSSILNEAHHLTTELYTDPANNHKYVFAGGLISANVFKFDVTDPLNIPPAELIVSSQVKKFAGTDHFHALPNGNFVSTFMGSRGLTTPGGLVEFSPDWKVVKEHDSNKAGGPTRYVPSINGETDTGLLSHPHGLEIRPDLGILVTSDFANPFTLASGLLYDPSKQNYDFGTTVRVWDLSNLAAGPKKIIQVPDGPRKEKNRFYEEPEGLMTLKLLHKPNHKGGFVSSVTGGTLYYSPDLTADDAKFIEVYDGGPNTGASFFDITEDDRFLVLPFSGILTPNDPGDNPYNRDYPGEHSRRIVVLDIEKLVNKDPSKIKCGAPLVINNPITGFTTKLLGHNNYAPDCPVEVSVVNVDSAENFRTHGGTHYIEFDKDDSRYAATNYFVDLDSFGLPGTGSGGDLKLYIANFNKKDGASSLDQEFKDELTGEIGVNFNRPSTYKWPGDRGFAGTAKPHNATFTETSY